jgi:hypothetical protein
VRQGAVQLEEMSEGELQLHCVRLQDLLAERVGRALGNSTLLLLANGTASEASAGLKGASFDSAAAPACQRWGQPRALYGWLCHERRASAWSMSLPGLADVLLCLHGDGQAGFADVVLCLRELRHRQSRPGRERAPDSRAARGSALGRVPSHSALQLHEQ